MNEFSCIAFQNSHVYGALYFHFLVQPGIIISPSNAVQLLSPSQLSLNCSAGGLPLASIYWITTLSDGSLTVFNVSGVLEDGRDVIITNTPSTANIFSVFSISSTLATDTANYTCRASNRLGTDDSTPSVVSIFGKKSIFIIIC